MAIVMAAGEICVGRKYLHYKGGLYEVVGIARHSETTELMVLYQSLNPRNYGELWVRPAGMWNEEVKPGVRRFTLVNEQAVSEREVQMYRPDVYPGDGTVRAPECCGKKMEDDGGCSDGCCDDWKCSICGRRIRTEAPD